MSTLTILERLERMSGDEREIVETIIKRISEGRRAYGQWHVDDGRRNPMEALMEVLDALSYCAAELVRITREVGR